MSSSYHIFDNDIRLLVSHLFPPTISILDVGPGRGKFAHLFPECRNRMDAVEVFEPFVREYNLSDLYRRVFIQNILTFEFAPHTYDLVILGDVLEHLTVPEAQNLLQYFHKQNAAVLVCVPYLFAQGEIENNPYEIHKQPDLTPELMEQRYPELKKAFSNNQYGVFLSKEELLRPISERAHQECQRIQASGKPQTPPPAIKMDKAPRRLLILQNPGNVSRKYLEGFQHAADQLGIEHVEFELEPLWQLPPQELTPFATRFEQLCIRHNIGAVLGYGNNSAISFPCPAMPDGTRVSFFENLEIPQLLFWTDHPHWHAQNTIFLPEFHRLLASPWLHHFVKNQAAAYDLQQILGWKNCHALPMAEEPGNAEPSQAAEPKYDIVAICGTAPSLPPELTPFLSQENPSVPDILAALAPPILNAVLSLWPDPKIAPPPALWSAFCHALIEQKKSKPSASTTWLIQELQSSHPEMVAHLSSHPRVYFELLARFWMFNSWERTFYLQYLARYFRVAVHGTDWSSLGIPGEKWVPYEQQAAMYATGKLAINISQGHDDEGATHKPFQIAASHVAMMHNDRKGLTDLFMPGLEIAIFHTPAEARELAADLLGNKTRRLAMADAAHHRWLTQHTWAHRLKTMFTLANLPLKDFLKPGA